MKHRYTFLSLIKLSIWVIRTKFVWRKARIIRFPFDLRGKKYIEVSEGFTTGVGCRLEAYPREERKVLHIGKNVQINDYVHISAMQNVTIGDNVLIASKVYISDLNHGNYKGTNQDSPLTIPSSRELSANPVIIKENVWIGEGVCIMPGVTIGVGCIVGASSVVTKNIPDYCIAVGSPAKTIRKYDFEGGRWVKIDA